MENEFGNKMSERSDEDLIRIVTIDRNGYQPLAIEAAEAEIKKRNIDDSNFEEIQENVAEIDRVRFLEELNKASLSNRFVNYLIDSTVATVGLILFLSIFIFVAVSLNINADLLMVVTLLLSIIIYFGYYYFMETRNGKTLGKYVTKTKVVKFNGDPPSNKDILKRTLCRMIPFDRFSFLFGNGFHDSISGTKVVNDIGIAFPKSNPDIIDSDFV